MTSETNTEPLVRLQKAAVYLEEVARELKANSVSIKDMTAIESVEWYWALKCAYDELDAARKDVYKLKDELEKFILPSKLDALGVDKIRVPELGRSFYTQTKYSASFPDKEKGFEWLRSSGNGALVQETVNASTLAAFCKNMVLEEGIDPPEDIINFRSYQTIGSSKYTPPKKAV